MSLPNVVIVGCGFGGLWAAQALRRARANVTVVDRTNHHLFSPLLYQVATAGLSAPSITAPIRHILASQKNATVLLGEAVGVDLARRLVRLEDGEALPYDRLIVATGATHSYFGHDAWAPFAPGLKTLDDAFACLSAAAVLASSAPLAESFHSGFFGSEVSPATSANATTMRAPRASPKSAPSARSRPPSPAAFASFESRSPSSVVTTRLAMKIATYAARRRSSGVRSAPGSRSASGPAKRLAARKAITQPASEISSRTSPRQAPHKTDTATTQSTA